MDQQVTCKIALVSFGSACSARMASLVGTVSNCNLATSGLSLDPVHHGKGTVGPGPHHQAPAVPGMFSSIDSGVWPTSRKGFDDFFLRRKVSADLTRLVRESFGGIATDPAQFASKGADLLARVESERELRGFSQGGTPQYATRWTMTLENRGNAAAEDLHFRFEVTDGDQAAAPTVMEADEAIRLLPPGGVVPYLPTRTHGNSEAVRDHH